MRIYFGYREETGCKVFFWDTASPARPQELPLRLDLWNHSPTGFAWGYGGSGPAQLALALAADALGDGQRAVDIHQCLKFRLVGRLPRRCWSVSADIVCEMITQLEADKKTREEAPSEQE